MKNYWMMTMSLHFMLCIELTFYVLWPKQVSEGKKWHFKKVLKFPVTWETEAERDWDGSRIRDSSQPLLQFSDAHHGSAWVQPKKEASNMMCLLNEWHRLSYLCHCPHLPGSASAWRWSQEPEKGFKFRYFQIRICTSITVI